MAVQTITYDNKVALNVNPDIANVNKITDNDMNEIKSVVNNNANNIGDLSNLTTPTPTNLVGAINSIVESGSNTNGSYVKCSDGTMICYKNLHFDNVAMTAQWGSFYESSSLDAGDYAMAFISTPRIFMFSLSPNFVEKYHDESATSWGHFYACKPKSATESLNIDCLAIGKWK